MVYIPASRSIEKGVIFSSFRDPVSLESSSPVNQVFVGDKFMRKFCANLPRETLEHIQDLRKACYSKKDIMEALNLPDLLPTDLVFEFLGRCSKYEKCARFWAASVRVASNW